MLALRTGWTPAVIDAMPLRFRAAAHWALFAEKVIGPEGIPSTAIPSHASQEERLAALSRNADVLRVRKLLGLTDV